MIPDELHMRSFDLMFNALAPYSDFAYNKYFATVRALDEFNFAPCESVPEVARILANHSQKWHDFWNMPQARQIADRNAQMFAADFKTTVGTLQNSWYNADAFTAGAAFAKFQAMLTTLPPE